MNRFYEEQEAVRLEEFLKELRKNPTTPPPAQLDPQLAEALRLTNEAEQAAVESAAWQLADTRDRVWQKTLANVEALNFSPAQVEPAREIQTNNNWPERPGPFVNYLPPEPVRQAKKVNWPGLVLAGMAATILMIAGAFSLFIFTATPGEGGPFQAGAPNGPDMGPNPVTAQIVPATVARPPTMNPQPTPTPYPAYKLTLSIASPSFTGDQVRSTAQVLEARLQASGINYVKATWDLDKIVVEMRGNVDEELVKKVATKVGRIEMVDVGDNNINVGDYLQTSYCISGSLLKPQSGLCGQLAPPQTPGAIARDPQFSTNGLLNKTTGNPFQTILTGDDYDTTSLSVSVNQPTQNTLTFKLKPEAGTVMKSFTESHLGQQMAITSDRTVILAATVQGVITDAGEISAPTKQDLTVVQSYLKSGPLPLSVQLVDFVKP